MAGATPRARTARRIARKTRAARRTAAPTALSRNLTMLVVIGAVAALTAAAVAVAIFDPRAEEAVRRSWRYARDSVRDLEDDLPSPRRLQAVAQRFSDAGQQLGDLVRTTAERF
ncbi:MAG: hypothetical protein ACREHE_13080 [Rhizomicrobium sp.]